MSAVDVALPSTRGRRRRLLQRRFLSRPGAVASLIVILVFVRAAVFAPLIAPADPSSADFGALLAHPSWGHLLGTDDFGRDVFSRLIWGARDYKRLNDVHFSDRLRDLLVLCGLLQLG